MGATLGGSEVVYIQTRRWWFEVRRRCGYLAFIGGVFVPVASGPGLLDTITRLSPHRWLLAGFGANSGTGTVVDVLIPTLVVAGMGVLLGAIAFGRRSKLTGVV